MLAVLILSASLLLAPAPVCAGTGSKLVLPPAGRKVKHNLRAVIDTRWADGVGYRRIKIRLIPVPAPSPDDRNIRVTIYPNRWSNRQGGLGISKDISMPAGAMSVDAEMTAPQFCLWRQMQVRVTENGSDIPELEYYSSLAAGDGTWSEAMPSILFIDSDAPTIDDRQQRISELSAINHARQEATIERKLKAPAPVDKRTLPNIPAALRRLQFVSVNVPGFNRWTPDLTVLQAVNSSNRIELLPPASLPQSWIGLSSFSIIYITLDEAVTMARNHQKRWEAIRDWTAAGNTLVLYGAGEKFERLKICEQLLNLPPREPLTLEGKQRTIERGWTPPDVADYSATMLHNQDSIYENEWDEYEDAVAVESAPSTGRKKKNKAAYKPVSDPAYVFRKVQFGHVFALREVKVGSEKAAARSGVYNSLPNNQWAWFKRSGISMSRRNSSYWDWLIPGVGGAPVITFCILITVFVVVIGPLNFWFVRKVNRPYLILVTVPLGAAVVTFGLFAFAIVTEGVSTRLRVRSVTHIDQRNNKAVVCSWQTYYASLAPSRGLVFSDKTLVFPLDEHPKNGETPYSESTPREVRWTGGQQILRSGFISSRSQEQFMVTQVQETGRQLLVRKVRDPAKPPQVTNQLGAYIKLLLIRDTRGAYWQGAETADGEGMTLKRAKLAQLKPVMAEHWYRASPGPPAGFDRNMLEQMNFGRMGGSSIDMRFGDPRPSTSILESNLAQVLLREKEPLKPGTYLAVTSSSPEVTYGTGWLYEEASLHVTTGNW